MTETPTRSRSAVDALADSYVDDAVALDPVLATSMGVAGHDHEMTDYSPAGVDARAALTRRVLDQVSTAVPQDDVDRVTVAAMQERLGLELEIHDAGMDHGELNVLASPAQGMRDVFDLMPTASAQDWEVVALRLHQVPLGVRGYVEGLRHAVAAGRAPARRQVEAVAAQCSPLADPRGGFFGAFTAGAHPDGGDPPPSLRSQLEGGASVAAAAYGELTAYLRDDLLPAARTTDAVGRQEYALWSRYFLGARVDLEETYRWGVDELARIEAEMADVAAQVVPGGSVEDAIAALDADPERSFTDSGAFRDWMQRTSDAALDALAGVHFDIPGPIRRLDCRIAPTSTGGIYYTGPSEDFSRPGTMWWSVPEGMTRFSTWASATTVFHEGVPGHHLQVAQTLYRAQLLNRWRRMMCWTSGHGEGWALYAERLMADLGWLEDPGDRLGMLVGSAFRAMRVVVDIGTHCGFEAPAEVGGGTWDADRMWLFMKAHGREPDEMLRFEHLRYLGWPGQAPSYKVGERLWLQLREQVRDAEGDTFDLKAFHRRALDVGSLGLDVLRDALVR